MSSDFPLGIPSKYLFLAQTSFGTWATHPAYYNLMKQPYVNLYITNILILQHPHFPPIQPSDIWIFACTLLSFTLVEIINRKNESRNKINFLNVSPLHSSSSTNSNMVTYLTFLVLMIIKSSYLYYILIFVSEMLPLW